MFLKLDYLQTTHIDDVFALMVFASVPIVAASAGFLLHCYATKPVKSLDSAEALMTEICAAHHVKAREQRLLSKTAKLAGVAQPAIMAAIPEVFDAAVQSANAKQSFSRSRAARLRQLRNRLFEESV